ncbi:AsmA-like C-terminal region-containing protein [Wenyingzhuangia sp. 1_MG-2023]|nr:AsmA-like C-terminal region-containing protein [Wenyingzhuangia sp. 1_MG-2023]
MTKKILKGLAIFVGIVFLLLLILPFAFKGKITKIAKEQINNSVNAKVDFQDLSISLLRSFPNVSVDLQNLSVINNAPFAGDTLAAVGHTYINIDLSSLLGDTPKINSIQLADAYIDVKVNKDSIANYDIALPSDTQIEETTTEEPAPFSLAIQEYSFKNINLKYADKVGSMSANVVNFNHQGKGDLSQNKLDLDTHTDAEAISFLMDDVAYLKDLKLNYDAIIDVDYANDLKLTFKNNMAQINDLNLAFDGVFTMLKDAYDLDFTFKSEKSEFKSLLSLIPNAYTADFPKVQTTGVLDFNGKVKGQYSETTIPTLDIVLKTDKASLKYPDLPNKIENIDVDAHITNTTGVMDDVVVEVKNFGFKIAKDVFSANALVTKPISNPTVKATVNGQIDLGNLKNAYPIPPLEYDLKGIVKASISTAFDMNAIEKEQYQKIDSRGEIVLQGVAIGSEYTPKPIFIQKTALLFNPKNVTLKETAITTGGSDVQMKGTLDNIYGYVFSNITLKGNVSITSNVFKVDDFYEADTTKVVAEVKKEKTSSKDSKEVVEEQFKIPENVEMTASVEAKKVIYDAMELTNFKGVTTVKDQRITFKNASANVFQGAISIDGFVDTKPNTTEYDFDMKLKQVDIASAFNGMGMLQKIAPIIAAFNGHFDSDFDIKGVLGSDFMPDLSQLTGAAFTNLQVDKIDASQNKFLSLAESKMSFLDFDKTDLKDLTAKVSFENSKVNVQPFTLNYKDIPVTIGGSHSFDNTMDYNLTLDLPAKYLGKEASSLVSKLSGSDQENIRVPLSVKVGGSITSPTVVPNMSSAISSLTKATLNKQKENLKSEAKNKLTDLLGLKKEEASDTTKTEEKSSEEKVKEAGKKILNGLFGK